MTGRPDYDAGDLVVCIADPRGDIPSDWQPIIGSVYTVFALDLADSDDKEWWAVDLVEDQMRRDDAAFEAECFRRIDPKPPEFFAGKIETVREDELV